MKRVLSLILCLAMILSCAACGSSAKNTAESAAQPASAAESGSAAGDTITLVDQADNTVTVPKTIDRIAVVGIWPLPSVLAVFFNSAEKIVAMPEPSMTAAKNGLLGQLYPEILNAKTDFMSGDQVNVEELLKLKPDVVFYSASAPAIGEQLKNAGFSAVAVSVNKWHYNCIETLNNWIKLLGEMFPENDKSAAVEKYSNDMYDMIQKRVSSLTDQQRARVFFLFQYSDSSIVSSGKNFFGQWWADAIGAKNVAEELTKDNSVPVNMEQIYGWNPQVIYITNFTKALPDDLYNNKIGSNDWSGIDAVKNKRVYKAPLGLYRSYTPGADTPVTLLWYAKTTYPDLFKDIDLTKEAKDYYKNVFGVELTDEQVNSIFTPTAEAAGGIK